MLYPVPNVFVPVVARATVALRAMVFVVLRPVAWGVVTGVRVVVVVLRATVLVRVAVRAVVRLTVLRAAVRVVVPVRVVVVALRADVWVFVGFDFARAVTLVVPLREILDASRTAASAIPIPAHSVAAKSKIFFILGLGNYDNKNALFWARVISHKCVIFL